MSLWYFAYGSNLYKPHLKRRIGEWLEDSPAVLTDFRLTFNTFSGSWGGGVADIVRSSGNKVLGAVYLVTEEQLRALDRYEGYPNFYNRKSFNVVSRGEKLDAVGYFVVRKMGFVNPSDEYFDVIRMGLLGHGYVPEEVDEYLKGVLS